MTQEDKELLLKDICARLTYELKVNVHVIGSSYNEDRDLKPEIAVSLLGNDDICIKPYLRPISSMTDEEMDKLFDILHIDKNGNDEDWIKINDDLGIKFFFPTGKWIENVAESYDYLNSIHIDYRGLINKGLALVAPEWMYKVD